MSDRLREELGSAAWLRRAPLYAYLAELIEGRRVLELGCGRGAGAYFLANHGAAQVLGVDRSEVAIAHATERYRLTNLEFRCEPPGSIEIEDSSVESVFVPAGAAMLRRKGVLDELRRVLASSGHLVFTVTSADRPAAVGGVTYHELHKRLRESFAPVHVIAQTPFVGLSMVELADDDDVLEVELDTSLTGGVEDATTYVAVCGAPFTRRGLGLVHVPAAPGLEVVAEELGRDLRAERRAESRAAEEESALVELRGALAAMQRQRDAAEERAASMAEQLEQAHTEIGKVTGDAAIELGRARADMQTLRDRLRDLEASAAHDLELTSVRSATTDTSAAIVQLADAMEAHAEHERALRAELDESRAYAEELYEEQERLRAELEAAARQVRAAEARAAELRAEITDWRDRTARAEGELMRFDHDARKGERNAALEAELGETRAKLARVTENWQQAEAKNDEVWRRVGALQTEIEQLREKSVERSASQRKEAQLSVARAMDDASKKLVAAQDELIQLRGQLERSEQLRAELEKHLEEAEVERVRLEDRVTEVEGRLEEASTDSAPPTAAAPISAPAVNGLAGRLQRIEIELATSRDLLTDLEAGLTQLLADPPAGFTTSERSRELAVELGIKDAEMTFLNMGISTLQARLEAVVEQVRAARARMDGLSASEMVAIMERLSADLAALTGAD